MAGRTTGVDFTQIIATTLHQTDNGYNVRDDLKHLDVAALQEIQNRATFPYHVLFFNLTGDLNIGSMIRTATLSGARKVWVFGRRKFDRRGLVGANNYIEIEQVNGFVGDTIEYSMEALDDLITENNLYPVYAESGGNVLGTFSWNDYITPDKIGGRTPVIVMGNEGAGFPDFVMDYFSVMGMCVTIPQMGVMRSFNVGHALSAILWDMRKDMKWV